MCGIIGVYDNEHSVKETILLGLISIQHRGQDACGIATFSQRMHLEKGLGLVGQFLTPGRLKNLHGNMGIGHVRYPTIGKGALEDAQPLCLLAPRGIAIAHNGNVINYKELRKKLSKEIRFKSKCDVEVILYTLAEELKKADRLSPQTVFKSVERIFNLVCGSYSVVSIIEGAGLLAFRDPYGIKPLVFGIKDNSYMFASESVALEVSGYKVVRDVAPGEAILITKRGELLSKTIVKKKLLPCIFEWVYFARPDSIIDNISVYESRLRLGKSLAEEVKKTKIKPDVVIPIPDTARACALSVAQQLSVKYREGLIKNRYIGRTFIMPEDDERKRKVRSKLNPIRSEINGKKVLLIDDSIVRGNTSKEIINLIRDAGAKKVYFASSSPPLRYPCVYGIDMQTRSEFVARGKDIKDVEKVIGADRLVYQTLEGLINSIGRGRNFCTACFNGIYPTEVPEEAFRIIEKERKRAKR